VKANASKQEGHAVSNWISAAEIRPGILHLKDGMPCQDRVAQDRIGKDIFVGVVCDGAGSAAHAEEGAALAVETATAKLKEIAWGEQPPSVDWAGNHMLTAVEAAKDALKQFAHTQGYALVDLRCTLLAVVATPLWLVAAQVGDGVIVVRGTDSDGYKLIFQPSKGEYANETDFITDGSLKATLRMKVATGAVQLIFISSDGLEGLSLEPAGNGDYAPRPKFFDAFHQFILRDQPSADQLQHELGKWLDSPKISGGLAYDDKGVVLAYRATAKSNAAEPSQNLEQPVFAAHTAETGTAAAADSPPLPLEPIVNTGKAVPPASPVPPGTSEPDELHPAEHAVPVTVSAPFSDIRIVDPQTLGSDGSLASEMSPNP
jgi:hypothetical protein